jgi:pyruvate dehydrogenase complex dehydrogenase (E1) component
MRYLREHRAALGGPLPQRRSSAAALSVPSLESYAQFALEAGGNVIFDAFRCGQHNFAFLQK